MKMNHEMRYLKLGFRHILLGLLLVAGFPGLSQNLPGTTLTIRKASDRIVIDGQLDEQAWQEADVAQNWFLNFPVDSVKAPHQTRARVTFDDQYFYFSFVCEDDGSKDLVNSLRRDFDEALNDHVTIRIGPYNDRLNGFYFALTPMGVQLEGTVIGGGAGGDSFNTFWDNKWYSEVRRSDHEWVAEAAIPFKSIRYKDGLQQWNISFDRTDRKRNQKSSWINTPIQYNTGMFAYSGQLVWEDPLPPASMNISFIPYVLGNASRDREINPVAMNQDLQVGFDAKLGVTPALNLDLAINPDFSQVEVDEQVINLTRFEFRFPERRQLFLENSDLFSRAGLPEARAFFSRRVGLVRDSTGLFQRVPILYGARLSGSITPQWRLSVLNTQTRKQEQFGLPAQNYAVATLQRNFWAQSNVAVTFVNKQSLGVDPVDSLTFFHNSLWREVLDQGRRTRRLNQFNRVLDIDVEMLSKDNKWHASLFAARSFDDFHNSGNYSGGIFFEFASRHLYVRSRPSYIGRNFNAEAGFVPSYNVYPGQLNWLNMANIILYPASANIVRMGPTAEFNHTYLPNGTITDKEYGLGYEISFANTARLSANYNYIYQRLTNDFNPVDRNLYRVFKEDEIYDWHTASVELQTNARALVNALVACTYGGFYNGTNLNVNGQINVRYQPYGNLALRFDFNDLQLPGEYGQEKLFLIGPRLDVTLTDELFLTTYFQYNNLLDNMNLNTRLQWRYRPASDLFVVYTENYLPANFYSKNRALVLKLNHWFNI